MSSPSDNGLIEGDGQRAIRDKASMSSLIENVGRLNWTRYDAMSFTNGQAVNYCTTLFDLTMIDWNCLLYEWIAMFKIDVFNLCHLQNTLLCTTQKNCEHKIIWWQICLDHCHVSLWIQLVYLLINCPNKCESKTKITDLFHIKIQIQTKEVNVIINKKVI